MFRSMKSSILILFLSLFLVACKKNTGVKPADQSANEIVLSINNAPDIHYNKPSTNPATEINSLYVVNFERSYYLNNTYTSINQVNMITMNISAENLSSQAFPYTPENFEIFVTINVPENLGTFAYPVSNANGDAKEHVALTVNSFKGQRIQGVFNGVIYSSYNEAPQPDSLSIKGSFDILLPAYVNN
jgi:hypothetical protein